MTVRELMEELSKLPQNDLLIITYFHEDTPRERFDCDIHDILTDTGGYRGTSHLEIVGRGEAE